MKDDIKDTIDSRLLYKDLFHGYIPIRKVLLLILIYTVSMLILNPTHAVAATMEWQYRPDAGVVDCSPGVGDLDGDGVREIVICTTAGEVIVLDSNGQQKWSYDTEQIICTPPTVAVKKNKKPLVLALTFSGKIICLAGDSGRKLWDYAMPRKANWGTTTIAAADINQDGLLEFVSGDKLGNLVCLDEKGSQLWKINLKERIKTAPALADLDGDGQCEILVGTKATPLVCLSSQGKEIWRLPEEDSTGSGPLVCDLDGDKQPEILLGQGKGLSVLDNKGNQVWHYPMQGKVHDAVAVGDIDSDGQLEIIAVDLSGQVACLSTQGKLKWTADVEKRARRSPAIADIDGDSVPEVIIGGYSSAVHIFDPFGNLKERVSLAGPMNASPTIVDFKGDKKLSLICATAKNTLALTWIENPPQVACPVWWSQYRGDSARSAFVNLPARAAEAHIAQIDYGKLYTGENDFRVTVGNPRKENLKLQLQVVKDDGVPVLSELVSSESTFKLTLPYSIRGSSILDLEFVCNLFSGEKLIAVRKQSFCILPFSRDISDVRKTLNAIYNYLPDLIDQDYAADRLTVFADRLSQMEEQVISIGLLSDQQCGILRDDMAMLRTDSQKLRALVQAAAETDKKLAVFGANPWAPFGGLDEIVEGRTTFADLKIEAFGSETESAALNLANFSSQPVMVRVEPQPISTQNNSIIVPAQKVLEFHEVVDVPTGSSDYSADALPLMGQARTILIPAFGVRQLWVNVDVSSLAPGEWNSKIRLRTLEVESQEVTVNLSIEVWEAHLPKTQPLRLCHWGYVHRSILKDQPDAALVDQVRHGTNVFVATGQFAPQARFDKDGNIVGDIDYTQHDEYVRGHSPWGLILFCGYQGGLHGPAGRFTPVWEKAYKSWLNEWFNHLQQMGLKYEDYALYPVDEPGLYEGLVDNYVSWAKPVRQVNPHVQIYVDPVAGATMSDLQKMSDYVDIWCPNRVSFLLDKGAEKLAYIKSTNKTVWTYECQGSVKHRSPLGYYRSQAWLSWHHGLTGIGFWSYCTSDHDPWYVPVGGDEHLLIYQGKGVVTSKRWEAVRDGVEDYSMLVQLRDAVQKASNQPSKADTVRAARELLNKQVSVIASYCGLDEVGFPPGSKPMAIVRQEEDTRWRRIIQIRREIARLLAALCEDAN